jgi:hypothetical protein
LTRRRSLRRGGLITAAALALLVPAGVAQEAATPTGGTPTTDGPHPAHIHAGTCAALGDIVAPLTEVADPTGTVERTGPATARGVKASQSTVALPLDEIIAGGHAVNVHLSAEAMGTYIACGDVGVAWLGADGEQTEVVVVLVEPDEPRHAHRPRSSRCWWSSSLLSPPASKRARPAP